MVHPCGSGAFGYFECTKDVTSLTVSLDLSNVTSSADEHVESQFLIKRW